MRYHLAPVRMARMKKIITNIGKDTEEKEPLCTVGGHVNLCNYTNLWKFLKKLEISYDPVIEILDIYPKNTRHQVKRIYVYCSTIYNSQIIEVVQVSINR